MTDLFQTSSAVISPCGRYRYRLDRRWAETGPTCGFIMLNPSTADADQDDPTIRRCIGFARREGCGGMVVVNLFALRATNPDELILAGASAAEGALNATHIIAVEGSITGPFIAAWGAHPMAAGLADAMEHHFGPRLMCLGKTKTGAPRHPLYVRADAPLIPYR